MGTERDSRLNSRNQSDDRQNRGALSGAESQERAATPEAAEGTSDAERLDLFRMQLHQSVMPELPKIPGYHVCWLTTQNPRDTIMMRQRLGYEPIKASDFPGLELMTQKTGDYTGCIAVNEMIACKLPMRLYNAYMKHNHHDAPMAEEDKLRTAVDVIADAARKKGAEVLVEEGNSELGQAPKRPVSFQG